MTTAIGWCHECGRDIARIENHALGCPASDRGPEHPEIAPAAATYTVVITTSAASDELYETLAMLDPNAEVHPGRLVGDGA